jgi:hypothetical protein
MQALRMMCHLGTEGWVSCLVQDHHLDMQLEIFQNNCFLQNGEELATFKQVEQEESWRMAMADEFNSIVENDT